MAKPLPYVTWSVESYTLVNGVPRASSDTSRPPKVSRVSSGNSGYWAVYAYLANGTKVDISTVRGAPTLVQSVSTTDPFGPAAATLVFPAVSILDSLGSGDLAALAPELNVDIVWVNADPNWGTVGSARYTWEGYFVSYSYSGSEGYGLTVACNGALKQMDNYLAIPEKIYRPLPYEYAIRRQFFDPIKGRTQKYRDLRLANPTALTTIWPTGWSRTFSSSDPAYDAAWKIPQGVSNGDKWTGLLTRETGGWEPSLTGYIQGLLTNMQFDGTGGTVSGQFTMTLGTGRVPTLAFRPYITSTSQIPLQGGSVLSVDLLWPGVSLDASQDWTQRANVAYGQGTARDGQVYSGAQVSEDGSTTYYDPLSWSTSVFPSRTSNSSFDATQMRKEANLPFGDGLTPKEAAAAAQAYLIRYKTPGVTGTLTLDTDPVTQSGSYYPRQIIQAGSTVQVKNAFGSAAGILLHVTEVTVAQEGTVTLTVDSNYRDQLTVDQVMMRAKDSLIPFRTISTAGTYSPKVPDLLYPWNYDNGAGVVPEWRNDSSLQDNSTDIGLFRNAAKFLSNATNAANVGFVDDANYVEFPWTTYTKIYPPSNNPQYYMRIPAQSTTNPDYNWANRYVNTAYRAAGASTNPYGGGTNAAAITAGFFRSYKVKLAAKGRIRLVQIAAYDSSGNVKTVPFHVSFFKISDGITYQTMPMLAVGHTLPPNSTFDISTTSSPAYNKHYPFFAEAWEKISPNGTTPTNTQQLAAADGQSFLAGWGTYYERAGYWPGSSAKGDPVTGLLQDEVGFDFDFTSGNADRIDPQKSYAQQTAADVWISVMIYCESTTDTYFLGRLWADNYQ